MSESIHANHKADPQAINNIMFHVKCILLHAAELKSIQKLEGVKMFLIVIFKSTVGLSIHIYLYKALPGKMNW